MLSTLQWARSAGLDVPNHGLDTLMALIGFEIRVRPMHSTLVGAQAVADVFRFLLRRCYPYPTHEGEGEGQPVILGGGVYEVGDRLELSIHFPAALGKVSYEWYKDGNTLSSFDATYIVGVLDLRTKALTPARSPTNRRKGCLWPGQRTCTS